jgi:hypothetical protein
MNGVEDRQGSWRPTVLLVVTIVGSIAVIGVLVQSLWNLIVHVPQGVVYAAGRHTWKISVLKDPDGFMYHSIMHAVFAAIILIVLMLSVVHGIRKAKHG